MISAHQISTKLPGCLITLLVLMAKIKLLTVCAATKIGTKKAYYKTNQVSHLFGF